MRTAQRARAVRHRPCPVLLLHAHVGVSRKGRHAGGRAGVRVGVACVVGHGQIAVVQVVLAMRPTERERNRKSETERRINSTETFIIQPA